VDFCGRRLSHRYERGASLLRCYLPPQRTLEQQQPACPRRPPQAQQSPPFPTSRASGARTCVPALRGKHDACDRPEGAIGDNYAMAAENASPVFRPGGISYLRIPAEDPQATASFYQHVFGWNVDTNRPDPSFEDGTGHVIGHFVSDGAVAAEAGVRPYVYVDSVDGAITQVATHGGVVVEEPYPEGDLWVATFRDPAGNVIGVWQRGPRH